MRLPDRRLKLRREIVAEMHRRHPNRGLHFYFGAFAVGLAVGRFVLGMESDSTLVFAIIVGILGVILGSLLIERPAARRLLRERTGKCIHCGYDLRATPNRCPECGAVLAMSLN